MTATAVGKNGIIVTDTDGNKRFAGPNPNNWVCFGNSSITKPEDCDDNHKWRIIGEFDGKLKIMTSYYYSTKIAFDINRSNVWANASLKKELNGSTFYSNAIYIDEAHRDIIINATWYTGGQSPSTTYTLQAFIDGEKSSNTTGKVGLMSMVDFGYAGSGCITYTDMNNSGNACMDNNWIGYSNLQWSITPQSRFPGYFWLVQTLGYVSFNSVTSYTTYGARPSVYLEANVKIIAGSGTESEPYILSM